MRRIFFLVALVTAAGCPVDAMITYFANTNHRLDVYVCNGELPGRTALVLGGIHGNETGAVRAAEALTRLPVARGRLVVIPHVNGRAIFANLRGVGDDMNRMFDPAEPANGVDAEIVAIVKSYIADADLLLNLHDAWGFYSPVYKDDLRNPARYGQSVIADCGELYSWKYGSNVPLRVHAERVLDWINGQIDREDECFHFWDHETFEPSTRHPEQRKSATYYAAAYGGIPAFGIETSRNLRTDLERVRYHTMIVHEFLSLYGIWTDSEPPAKSAFELLPADIQSLVSPPEAAAKTSRPAEAAAVPCEVNGLGRWIVAGEELRVARGDRIRIARHPGIRVNVVGFVGDSRNNTGFDNGYQIDTSKDLMHRYSVDGKGDRYRMRMFRENKEMGSATLQLIEPRLTSVDIETEDGVRRVEGGRSMDVLPDSRFRIVSVETNLNDMTGIKVNLVGFAGRGDGEDRGAAVETERLLAAFSIDRRGETYAIRVTRSGKLIGTVFVRIQEEPRKDVI
ncbi:MAG: M99 family carboxypeptidase catalytic domain-containing protein [Acidobacteriota bacterium]